MGCLWELVKHLVIVGSALLLFGYVMVKVSQYERKNNPPVIHEECVTGYKYITKGYSICRDKLL